MQHMQPQMYDRASTVFSPDGRLYQVEYAREAVKRGTTAVGIKFKDGIVLLVDKRINSRLIEADSIKKIFSVDDHIGAATSGLVADARALIDKARVEAQINRVSYDEPIGVEVLAKKICDHKQTFTQYGGARPYGTALLIGGIEDNEPRLYETDPSGALLEYRATAIGAGRPAVIEVFEADYNEDMTSEEAIDLGLTALYKASEGRLKPDTLEIGVITVSDQLFQKLASDEVERYAKEVIETQKASEDEEIEKREDEANSEITDV